MKERCFRCVCCCRKTQCESSQYDMIHWVTWGLGWSGCRWGRIIPLLTLQLVPIRRLWSPPCQPRQQVNTREGLRASLRPGHPRETPELGVLREASEQRCVAVCGSEHPAASSDSASYCLRIALSSRMGGEQQRGSRRGERKALPLPQRSGQSQRSSAGSRRCSLSPYRLCCLQRLSDKQICRKYSQQPVRGLRCFVSSLYAAVLMKSVFLVLF